MGNEGTREEDVPFHIDYSFIEKITLSDPLYKSRRGGWKFWVGRRVRFSHRLYCLYVVRLCAKPTHIYQSLRRLNRWNFIRSMCRWEDNLWSSASFYFRVFRDQGSSREVGATINPGCVIIAMHALLRNTRQGVTILWYRSKCSRDPGLLMSLLNNDRGSAFQSLSFRNR